MGFFKRFIEVPAVIKQSEKDIKQAEKDVKDIIATVNGEDSWFLCMKKASKECKEE